VRISYSAGGLGTRCKLLVCGTSMNLDLFFLATQLVWLIGSGHVLQATTKCLGNNV